MPDFFIIFSDLGREGKKVDKPADQKNASGEYVQDAHSNFVHLKLVNPDKTQ